MKRIILYISIALVTVLVIAVALGGLGRSDGPGLPPSLVPGLTPDEAKRVKPVVNDLTLTAQSTKDGIRLQWSAIRDIWTQYPARYFDVYKSCPATTSGPGEKIARLDAHEDHRGPYEFTDTASSLETTCDYQVVGVWISGRYEVAQYLSNHVEVQF